MPQITSMATPGKGATKKGVLRTRLWGVAEVD
jgi:hypothetical protein